MSINGENYPFHSLYDKEKLFAFAAIHAPAIQRNCGELYFS